MKKFILIIAFTFTSCSLFKNTHKNTLETTTSKETQQLEHVSGLELAQSSLLSQSWANDSTIFQAYIQADGPYKISPDSGIQGTHARIYITATKNTKKHTQDSIQTQQLHKQDSLSMQATKEQTTQKQKSIVDQRINIPIIGYIIPLLLLAAWFLYRKYFR